MYKVNDSIEKTLNLINDNGTSSITFGTNEPKNENIENSNNNNIMDIENDISKDGNNIESMGITLMSWRRKCSTRGLLSHEIITVFTTFQSFL